MNRLAESARYRIRHRPVELPFKLGKTGYRSETDSSVIHLRFAPGFHADRHARDIKTRDFIRRIK